MKESYICTVIMNYGNSVMVCGSIIFRMLKISFGEKYNWEKKLDIFTWYCDTSKGCLSNWRKAVDEKKPDDI